MADRGRRRAVIAGVLLTAALLVGARKLWLVASLPVGRPRSAALGAASPDATGAAGVASETAPARATRDATRTRPRSTIQTETSDELRARLARQALENRARNDTRHAQLSARWASETRDEPWSTDQEHALRAAATAAAMDHLVVELECRRTLCRLELSAADSDTAFALQRAHAFTALLGADTGSAMLGGGPDRAMEVFAAREGMGSPKGP